MNLLLLAALVEWAGWHYLLAAAVSIEASTLWNYVLNRAWTWRDRDRSWWSLLSYHGVVAVGLAAQWATIAVGTGVLGFHYLLTAAVGIGLGTTWNFLANHRITFQAYTPERRRRHLRVAGYVGALVLQLGLAAVLMHDWDTFVFQRSVEDFLRHGVTPYDIGHEKPAYTYVGYGLPLQPLWYAYPPLPLLAMSLTYWPAALGVASAPWAGRLLIHLPFILSNLGLAAIAHRMVRTPGDAGAIRAAKLERVLLFNPLFILVATVWGMFESLLLILLLGSFLFLRDDRHVAGGALFGAATLVKIFPVYLVPVLGLWILRRTGFRAAVRYFAAGAAVFAAVSLPFYLANPAGFVEQVFLMHADRAPAHYGIFSFLLGSLRMIDGHQPGLLPPEAAIIDSLNLLSFTATAVILVALALGSLRDPADERHLLFWTGLSLAGGILATKIVSEQYSLLPLGVLAIALYHPGALADTGRVPRLRAAVIGVTFGMTLAAIVNHVGLLLFVPEDVALFLFGRPIPAVVADIAAFYGVGVAGLGYVLGLVVGLVLVPVLLVAVQLLGPELARGFGVVWDAVRRVLRPTPGRHVGVGTVAAICVALVLFPPLAMGVLAPRPDATEPGADAVDVPALLVRYKADWVNPTHRTEVPAGTWGAHAYTPATGYYSVTSHKMVQDLDRIKRLGADAVVLDASPTGDRAAGVAAQVAENEGLAVALEVDLAHVARPANGLVMTATSADTLAELLDGPGLDYWGRAPHLLDPSTGDVVVFLRGAEWLANASMPSPATAPPINPDPDSTPDVVTTSSAADGPSSETVPATGDHTGAWWARAFRAIPSDRGIVLYADGPVELPADLATRVDVRAIGDETVASLVDIPCDPGRVEDFDAAWVHAMASGAELVVVTWNGYNDGEAIEPTREHGDLLQWRTALWIETYRTLGPEHAYMASAFLDGGAAA